MAAKAKVSGFCIFLEGYGAAPGQSLEDPCGKGGRVVPAWLFPTKYFASMTGKEGGSLGIDNEVATRSMENTGAWIMGRNMFSPTRGAWPDESWKGWWGPNPPYHCKVFVLTHHFRPE